MGSLRSRRNTNQQEDSEDGMVKQIIKNTIYDCDNDAEVIIMSVKYCNWKMRFQVS